MDSGKFLYLTRSDVDKCGVTLARSLEISENTYSEHAKGNYEMPPKPGVHPSTCPGAFHHAMPAYLPNTHAVGIKWVAVYGHNPGKHGINSTSALMVLNDEETGYPVAVMEAGLITAIRTANASGVSAKYLARKDSKVIGLVGCGEQGRFNIRALLHVLPGIKEVKLYDLYPNMIERLIEFIGPTDVKFTVCECAKDVIVGSDVVVTSAPIPHKEPVYEAAWVKEGALVLPVHCNGWTLDFFKSASKFVVDDWNQYHSYMFGPEKYYTEDLSAPYAQLGEVINGVKKGRENDQEIIVNSNLGIALQDVALGFEVLKLAKEKGIGTELSLY